MAKLLAKKLILSRISAGEIFREKAKEKNMSLLRLTKYSETHPEIDHEIDECITRYGKKDDVILEGRLTGWIATKHNIPALKVWLSTPLPVRVIRIAERDKKSYQSALEQLQKRENPSIVFYRQSK